MRTHNPSSQYHCYNPQAVHVSQCRPMTWNDFAAWDRRTVGRTADYHQTLRERPVLAIRFQVGQFESRKADVELACEVITQIARRQAPEM